MQECGCQQRFNTWRNSRSGRINYARMQILQQECQSLKSHTLKPHSAHHSSSKDAKTGCRSEDRCAPLLELRSPRALPLSASPCLPPLEGTWQTLQHESQTTDRMSPLQPAQEAAASMLSCIDSIQIHSHTSSFQVSVILNHNVPSWQCCSESHE